jgi:hypothetical protein
VAYQSFVTEESTSFTVAWEEETKFSIAEVELAWYLHLGGKPITSNLLFVF